MEACMARLAQGLPALHSRPGAKASTPLCTLLFVRRWSRTQLLFEISIQVRMELPAEQIFEQSLGDMEPMTLLF